MTRQMEPVFIHSLPLLQTFIDLYTYSVGVKVFRVSPHCVSISNSLRLIRFLPLDTRFVEKVQISYLDTHF